MQKTAVLLGATGLVGSILLEQLLKDENYTRIKVFGRSSCGSTHKNVEEHLGDLFDFKSFASHFTGDVVFCCIGTTKAKTPDKTVYKKIDYGIPLAAASLAKQNGISHFQVISAMGAHPESNVFYNKIKGEMERDLIALQIKNTYIFKPSLIGGDRNEKRLGEKIGQFFFRVFDFLIPSKYKMIAPKTIAQAMVQVAQTGFPKIKIESNLIKNIATRD